MPRQRSHFSCADCGATTPKWHGRCPECGAWNSLTEVAAPDQPPGRFRSRSSGPVLLAEIETEAESRVSSGLGEFDRVLGGGIVPGELILLGGDPGIGKSTLLLQFAARVAAEAPVLYVSGEESARQLRLRSDRVGATVPQVTDLRRTDDAKGGAAPARRVTGLRRTDGARCGAAPARHLYILTETNLQVVLREVERLRPRVIIVDSIQTAYLDSVAASPGSITQLRECTLRLMDLAKATEIATFLVGHVTKDGNIAGPRVLEHIVDAVLYLEGERFHAYRLLRATKNRFGSTDEVGVFEMAPTGLREVSNPSAAFLAQRVAAASGSAVAVPLEGSRALLVEVQALVAATAFGMPRRTVVGVDLNRLHLLIAVLTKRLGLALGNQDVYVNAVGGLKLAEPACDLGLAAAIASSYRDKVLPADLAFLGEVGLQGELRPVNQIERRLTEAQRMGFRRCVVPASDARRLEHSQEPQLVGAAGLREAFESAFC